jgi:putative membrane protein
MRGRISVANIIALMIPLLLALSLSFLPIGEEVDLFALDLGGYALLLLVGIIGSAAMVIPGISGSMLLLILGYYNPIVKIITEHFLLGKDVASSLLVLGTTGLGIAVGFYFISLLMKQLLIKCPHGTYLAIIGFILGSVPSIFVSTAKEAGITLATLKSSPWHLIFSVLLLAVGVFASYSIVILSRKQK